MAMVQHLVTLCYIEYRVKGGLDALDDILNITLDEEPRGQTMPTTPKRSCYGGYINTLTGTETDSAIRLAFLSDYYS